MMEDRFNQFLEGRGKPLDRAVLADDIKGEDYPYVIKLDGTLAEDPAAFILANYGAALSWRRADPHPDGKYIFRLVGFHEIQRNSLLVAYCIDRETQEPLPGKAMIRWWPDAPKLQGEILPPASAWYQNGIMAYVKADGTADWGVGHGEAYYPETGSGVCKVWGASLDGPWDLVEGWGWLNGTQYRSLAPIFERIKVGDDGGNGETVDLSAVVAAIDKLTAAVEKPRTIT